MADIKNKNELKRRIELFMDELDYSINEEFCKETMIMMREFIGRASHLLDCTDAKIKKAKRTARNKAIDEFAERLKKLYQAYDIDLCLQDNDHLNYTDSRIALESYIDEIAEQMRKEV